MRLYLSSFRLGYHPEKLVELCRGEARAAVVLNACDHMSETDRSARLHQEFQGLDALGIAAAELDLRSYFPRAGARHSLKDTLADGGLLWVRGGNTFVLRRALKESGLDSLLADLLLRDRIAYGGFSAAGVVLAPSLRGVDLVDDPHMVPEGYNPVVPWDGLNVLPYAFAPHYRSDHPESADTERMVQFFIENHIPFVALRDGAVLVIDGAESQVLT